MTDLQASIVHNIATLTLINAPDVPETILLSLFDGQGNYSPGAGLLGGIELRRDEHVFQRIV